MLPSSSSRRLSLRAFPGDSGSPALDIQVEWCLDAGGLQLAYRLAGDLAGLRIPAAGAALDPDRLWAHTCFEVFLARGQAPGYREYNFSPSGQWAGYAFEAYRQRLSGTALPAPDLAWSRGANLGLRALLPATALPPGNEVLRLGLTAVVELQDGGLGYWALHHPASRPDFHHRDGFTLTVTP